MAVLACRLLGSLFAGALAPEAVQQVMARRRHRQRLEHSAGDRDFRRRLEPDRPHHCIVGLCPNSIGGDLGKIFNFGSQPVNASVQSYYNVATPNFGPAWSLRQQLQFLFPK
jgi:hypothetical protein